MAFAQHLAFFACLVASIAAVATADGLVDHPLAADGVTYLDGEWRASATIMPPRPADCSFEDNIDFNHGTGSPNVGASSQAECCAACAKVSDCAAAVFAPKQGLCWLKSDSDVQKKSTVQGVTACVVQAPQGQGQKVSIPAQVPGDLLTDLHKAGLIGDPLYELNFLNASTWDANTWTFTTSFTAPADSAPSDKYLLVFDGIKMGSRIELDGTPLGTTTDQFLRYELPLGALVAGSSHSLSVIFDPKIDCGGRWMSCTGGWDWAPYTNTAQDGIPTFSKGIWKSVSLVKVSSAAITHVVPQILYAGEYPTEPLTDSSHGGFDVSVRVHTWATATTTSTVTVKGDWVGATASQEVSIPAGNSSFTIALPRAQQVQLWWPVGQGAQPLYNLSVSISTSPGGGDTVTAQRRVGFRFFALVTGDDTDPAYVKASEGADGTTMGHGMLWRVNGAAIFSKGANMIPMEELEGRMAANAHRQLVQSAVDGGMNTLRVWGGGMFLPREWYEACDELGIMVYHDMQYAQSGHSPVNNQVQDAELRHQIRRLASHASIVMWDGCNECRVIMGTDTGVYATFVMTVVAQEDASRAVWPSCPALGWSSGVDRLTAMPNGKPLTTPSGGNAIETHGPYQHGTGFPAVNGASSFQPVSSSMNGGNPISLTPNMTNAGLYVGISQPNIFASEFGSSVYSSFESMAPTIAQDHWSIHGGTKPDNCSGSFASKCRGDNVMAQRNYPCDNIIIEYFGGAQSDFDTVGEETFKQQLWQCMVGQALLVKSDIETRRAGNTFGIIVWQFNEIWPTGGWGSLEYGTVGHTAGQVLGGRWKPLHYWYKASILQDVTATCGNDDTSNCHDCGIVCYVKNDSPQKFKGVVGVSSIAFADGKSTQIMSQALDMPAGAGTIQWFHLPKGMGINGTKEMLMVTVQDAQLNIVATNPVAFAHPKDMALPKAKVTLSVGVPETDGGSVPVTVVASDFALYVTLTTLAQGRFEDNAFVMGPGTKTVQFFPFDGFDWDELLASLRVEHTATYMRE